MPIYTSQLLPYPIFNVEVKLYTMLLTIVLLGLLPVTAMCRLHLHTDRMNAGEAADEFPLASPLTPGKSHVICPLGSDDCLNEQCVGATCSLPKCAQVPRCQAILSKRNADPLIHPVCDICIISDGQKKCGCETDKANAVGKRATNKVCPLFCIRTTEGKVLCGCAAQAYESSTRSAKPTPTPISIDNEKRCPQYCITDKHGKFVCGCAAVTAQLPQPTPHG